MKKSMFMLCLGFMGLQGADAGTRITTHEGKVTVERVPPEYTGSFPARLQASATGYPSAPALLKQTQILDVVTCSEEELSAALVQRALAEQGICVGQTQTLPKATSATSYYRSTGPVSLPTAVPTLARLQQRFESGPFDSSTTDSDSDNSPQAAKPTHQRQRSLSNTDALTAKQQSPSSNPTDDTNSLQRWRQPSSPLTLDDFDLNALSPHSATVFQQLVAVTQKIKNDMDALLQSRYGVLLSVEEKPNTPPALQKATENERRTQLDKTRKKIATLHKIHKDVEPKK